MKTFRILRFVFLSILLLGCLFFIPNFSIAQTIPADTSISSLIPGIQEQLSIDISPEVPQPNDSVTISVEAYGTDLNRAPITWTLNGKKQLSSIGAKKFTFTVGDIGSKNDVTLHIEPINGTPIDKTFSFSPSSVDVLWEANTYTPPFYKGKALNSPEADLSFVAIPNLLAGNQTVSPNNAVYTWKLDYSVQGDKSGYGKDVFNYTGDVILKPHNIRVEAYTPSNPNEKAVGDIDITNSDPLVLFYQNHPLYGILFNRELGDQYVLNTDEVNIAAIPYNFSGTNKNYAINYDWGLNDATIDTKPTENLMTIRKNGIIALDGSSILSANVTSANPDKILQFASHQLDILFNK